MPAFQSLIGQRFGRLVVVQRAPTRVRPSGGRTTRWLCRCDCGVEKDIIASSLRDGLTGSCGCLNSEGASTRFAKHRGRELHPLEYNAFNAMHARCSNPKNDRYPRYGGRGITVCERWSAFATFLADMGPKPSARHSIERDNNDQGYGPGNCRWATPEEQGANMSTTIRIRLNGSGVSLRQAAASLSLPYARTLERFGRLGIWALFSGYEKPTRAIIDEAGRRFERVRDAAKFHGLRASDIAHVLAGRQRVAKGHTFRLAEGSALEQ